LRFVNTKVIQALNELPITFPLQKQKLKGAWNKLLHSKFEQGTQNFQLHLQLCSKSCV
jgi:hypothetical protein